jgi:hypothetical protein
MSDDATPIPEQWQFFRAHGCTWQAVGRPVDLGGAVGRAVRAGRVFYYELRAPGEEPEVKLDGVEWVQLSAIEAVLDPVETMAAHLKDRAVEEVADTPK